MRGLDKSPSLRLGVLLAAIIGGAVMASASRVLAQTPAPDLTQGFELLRKAGLPDVKDWKYVRFEGSYYPGGDTGIDAFLAGGQAGNAWLEASSGSPKMHRLLIDGSRLVAVSSESGDMDVAPKMQAAETMGLQFSHGTINDLSFAGGDANQNPEAADAARFADHITKLAADEEGKERFVQNRGLVRNVFFMAAHYHRRGYEKESAQIVAGLQQVLSRPEALIELSVDKLGDMRLHQSVTRFRVDHDWKALQTSLESVMADFPELWGSRPLAERLLTQVKARSAGQAPPPISDGPFVLTGEQKDWWKKVTEGTPVPKKEGEQSRMGQETDPSQWGHAWLTARLRVQEDSDSDPFARHRQGGDTGAFDAAKDWDWVTVMAAALGDNTVTLTFGSNSHHAFDFDWRSFDPERAPAEMSEAELEQRWERLGAPLTRDEIARAFLGTVLPLSEEHNGAYAVKQMNVEDLREAAKSWSAKAAGKKDLELTRLYFKEGSEEHRRMVGPVLARSGGEEDLALLEEVALSEPQNHIELATMILQKRKAAGKSFLEKFKTGLEETWKEEGGTDEIPDYIKAQLQALDGLVSGKGMKDIFADYASKKIGDEAFMQSVYSMQEGYEWKQEDVEAAFAALGKIPAAEGQQRSMMVEIASRGLKSLLGIRDENEPPTPGTPATENANAGPPPDWVRKLLKEFVEQHRDVTMNTWNGGSMSMGQYGYFMVETLWNPAGAAKTQSLYEELSPEFYWSYIESRGAAWLEGKQPPPVPDAARVTDNRKAEINAALQKLGEGGWPEYFAGLNLDEKLAASALVAELKPVDSWKKVLLTVTEVEAPSVTKRDLWNAVKGRVLDGALAKELLDLCQQTHAAEGKDLMGAVSFRSHYRGIEMRIMEVDVSERGQAMMSMFAPGGPSELEFTAMAYVRWQSRSGKGGTLVALREKEGTWKPRFAGKEGSDRRQSRSPLSSSAEDFEKGFNEALSEWSPASPQMLYLEFGVYKAPDNTEAEE